MPSTASRLACACFLFPVRAGPAGADRPIGASRFSAVAVEPVSTCAAVPPEPAGSSSSPQLAMPMAGNAIANVTADSRVIRRAYRSPRPISNPVSGTLTPVRQPCADSAGSVGRAERRLAAGALDLAAHRPVGLLGVLEADPDVVGLGLAHVDEQLGELLGDLALLLGRTALLPLDRDDRHGAAAPRPWGRAR